MVMVQSLDGDKTSAPWWKIGESLATAEKDFKQVRLYNFSDKNTNKQKEKTSPLLRRTSNKLVFTCVPPPFPLLIIRDLGKPYNKKW